MIKKIILLAFMALSITANAQTYTQAEVDLKMQLQQKQMDTKLQEMKYEKELVDNKIDAQDKRIEDAYNYQTKMVDIFGKIITVLTIIGTVAGFFIDRNNKKRKQAIEDDFEAFKKETEKQIEHIRQHAQLVAEKAQLEVGKAALQIEKMHKEAEISLSEIKANTNASK